MKRLSVTLLLAFILFSCNGEDTKEENPYPDGVYPFEVSGVSHTLEETFDYSITWTNPTDRGFSKATVELVSIMEYQDDINIYPIPDPNYFSPADNTYRDFTLKQASFSFWTFNANDHYVIIKCVDKFGNTSKGIKYEFSRN